MAKLLLTPATAEEGGRRTAKVDWITEIILGSPFNRHPSCFILISVQAFPSWGFITSTRKASHQKPARPRYRQVWLPHATWWSPITLFKTACIITFQVAKNFNYFNLCLLLENPCCFLSSLLSSQTCVVILVPVLPPNLQFIRTNYVRQLQLFSQDRVMGLVSRREAAQDTRWH